MKKDTTNIIGTNALYGRARRLEFIERAAYIVIAIISVILVFVIVGKKSISTESNTRFSYLTQYLEDRGYSCEMLYDDGGSCHNDTEASQSSFIRYDDGFQLINKGDGYLLKISYSESRGDFITLKTTASALQGYKNKEYSCYYKDVVLGEIDYCEDSKSTKLDSAAYLGVVDKAISDLNNILDGSGYSKDKLLKTHKWVKN